MASEHALRWRLLAWLLAMLVASVALAIAALPPSRPFTALLALLALTALLAATYKDLLRPWRLLDDKLDALTHGDTTRLAPAAEASHGVVGRVIGALDAFGARSARGQHEAQAAAQAQSALLDHAPVPLLCVDEDDRVSWTNLAARRLFGVEPLQRAQLHRFSPALAAAAEIGADCPATIDLQIDGSILRAALRASDLTLGTQRRRLLALQSLQHDLDAATGAATRNLARVVAHEMLNGLTPIVALADALDEMVAAPALSPEAHDALRTLARRARSLRDLALRTQQAASLPSPNRSPVALAPMLRDVLRWAEADAALAGVAFTLRIKADITLMADATLLQQALTNLVRNAAQAAQAAHKHGDAPAVQVTAQRLRSGQIAVDVDDNGAGVDENVRELMFLPFFTTRPEGSGIGAAVARQVALAHGGALLVQTAPELGGARLRMLLEGEATNSAQRSVRS
jgi:two-component system, NtrC family, nitrogen regulation sensor histidine kinase NtrY